MADSGAETEAGAVFAFEYDANGNLTGETDRLGFFSTTRLDARGLFGGATLERLLERATGSTPRAITGSCSGSPCSGSS